MTSCRRPSSRKADWHRTAANCSATGWPLEHAASPPVATSAAATASARRVFARATEMRSDQATSLMPLACDGEGLHDVVDGRPVGLEARQRTPDGQDPHLVGRAVHKRNLIEGDRPALALGFVGNPGPA